MGSAKRPRILSTRAKQPAHRRQSPQDHEHKEGQPHTVEFDGIHGVGVALHGSPITGSGTTSQAGTSSSIVKPNRAPGLGGCQRGASAGARGPDPQFDPILLEGPARGARIAAIIKRKAQRLEIPCRGRDRTGSGELGWAAGDPWCHPVPEKLPRRSALP